MEAEWREGVLWVSSESYEGPAELLSYFMERGKVPPSEVCASSLLEAVLPLFERMALEDRLEVLLIFARLLWLKVRALLPVPPLEEVSECSLPEATESLLSPSLLEAWGRLIGLARYRLARPPCEGLVPRPVLRPPHQMDLLRAYLSVQAARQKRLRRYMVQTHALSLETVARQLEDHFAQTPHTTLSAFFSVLPPSTLYRAISFFLILYWILEGRLHCAPLSVWECQLTWKGTQE